MIERREGGKTKIVKKHETPTRVGGVLGGGVGLATGLVVALFPFAAIGGGLLVGTTAGGAILGAVAGHAAAGMSRHDLKELGEHLDAGEAGLVVVAVSDMGAKVERAMKRASERAEGAQGRHGRDRTRRRRGRSNPDGRRRRLWRGRGLCVQRNRRFLRLRQAWMSPPRRRRLHPSCSLRAASLALTPSSAVSTLLLASSPACAEIVARLIDRVRHLVELVLHRTDLVVRLLGLLLRLRRLILLIVEVRLRAERPDGEAAGHEHQRYTGGDPAPGARPFLRRVRGARVRVIGAGWLWGRLAHVLILVGCRAPKLARWRSAHIVRIG